jgi:hypothetical protein
MRRSYALALLWTFTVITLLCSPLMFSHTYESWFLSQSLPATITAIDIEKDFASQKDEQLLHFKWKNSAGEDQTAYSGSRYPIDSYKIGEQVIIRVAPGKPETVSIHSWPNLIAGPLIYLAVLVGLICGLIITHRTRDKVIAVK